MWCVCLVEASPYPSDVWVACVCVSVGAGFGVEVKGSRYLFPDLQAGPLRLPTSYPSSRCSPRLFPQVLASVCCVCTRWAACL
jgi:hypothetical protein